MGKLHPGGHTPEEFLESAIKLGFQVINAEADQLASFHRLPAIEGHKDPFDRMLTWQAMQNDLTLLSHDRHFPTYQPHGLTLL